jgi:hypothetical protein
MQVEAIQMVVQFQLKYDENQIGHARHVELEGMSTPDPDFAECVLGVIRALHFDEPDPDSPRPKNRKSQSIRYPLIFK